MLADSQPIGAFDPIPLASGEYRLVLRALPDPVVAVDGGGLVAFANDAAEHLFGSPPGELTGQPIGLLVEGELGQAEQLGRLAGRRTRVRGRLRDGRGLELEMVVGLLPAPGGDLAVVCFRECKELQRQATAARYMRTASRAAALVSARLDLDHVLETMVDALTQELDAALARIWLVENGTELRVRASAGRARADDCLGERLALGEPSPIGQVALARLPILNADLTTDPRFPPRWLLKERILSGAVLPLTIGRELHGVLACFFHEPPADELVEILFTFAAMVAASVGDINLLKREQAARTVAEAAQQRLVSQSEADRSRARALALANEALSTQHEELENARRRLAAQRAVLQALAACTTLEQAAPRILEAIGTSMGWDVGTLWLSDAREASLRPAEIWAAPSTDPQDFIARARRVSYAVGEGLVGRVFQTGEPAWMDDATKCSAFRRAELAATAGLHGAVWFPIRHGNEVYGVVEFFRREPTTPDDETLLAIGALGRQIGQFIERVRAQRALQSSEERLATTLRSIGDAVVATDAEGRVEYMNPVAEALTGWRSDEARGRLLGEAVRFVDAQTRQPEAGSAIDATGRAPRVDPAASTLLIGRDGGEIFVEKSVGPILGARGEPVGVVLVFRDVTEKWRAEARGRFLSEASALLASSLDYEQTLSEIARVAVPSIADWCAVELLEGDSLRSLVICGADPVKSALAQAARQRIPPQTCRVHLAASPLGRGEALLYSRLDEPQLASLARDADHLGLLRRLNPRSALVAPLTARGRTQGTLLFAATAPLRFDAADLSLAQELGRRIGLALDNARLFHQAHDAVRARDEFLSIASHELKTPLTSLRLHVQGLEREVCRGEVGPERVVSKLRNADQQAGRLAGLINELLDVSNITAGRLHLSPETLDLTALVREVAGHFADSLGRVGCTLELWSPGAVSGHWDRMRLEQIVTNLLSNAIKYGAGKPIRLTIEKNEHTASLTVADQGIGISPEDLERIFARFERAVSARNYGGLGIGLYIVRRVLDAMGGSIRVRSTPGAGARFRVTLPLARAP